MRRILFILSAILVISWVATMIMMTAVSLFLHVLLIGGLFLAIQAVIITPRSKQVNVTR